MIYGRMSRHRKLVMDLSNLPVAQLIQRCVDADPDAWDEFMRRYNKLITNVVFRTVRSYTGPTTTLVEDLVHDTYLRLFSRDYAALRDFNSEHENAIFGYLKRITSSVVIDHFRKASNRPISLVPIDSVQIPDQRWNANRNNRIDIEKMRQCLKELLREDPDGECDLAIFDYDMSGCTAREIAQMLNMTVRKVDNRLARIRRKLRECLGVDREN